MVVLHNSAWIPHHHIVHTKCLHDLPVPMLDENMYCNTPHTHQTMDHIETHGLIQKVAKFLVLVVDKFDKNKVHSHNSLPGTKLHIFYTFFGHNPVLHTCTIDTTNIVQLFDRLVWCNMNDKWLQITCVPWDVTR